MGRRVDRQRPGVHPRGRLHRCGPATSASTSRLLVRKAGLPPVRFHDLRHGSATLSLAAGVDIKIVQEMLGHATSAFTRDVYTSVVPEIAAAAAEAVAAIVPRRANIVPTGG